MPHLEENVPTAAPTTKKERSMALARFIDDFMRKAYEEQVLDPATKHPHPDRWPSILVHYGVRPLLGPFAERGRFSEAVSPFEEIDPVEGLLQELHKAFSVPENHPDRMHARMDEQRALIAERGRSIHPSGGRPELEASIRIRGELQSARQLLLAYQIVACQLGAAYSLAWHWLEQQEADEAIEQVDADGQEAAKLGGVIPVPADITWGDVEIAFMSDQVIQITVGRRRKQLMFNEAGFADGRKTDQPDTRWDLLLAAAHDKDNRLRPVKGARSLANAAQVIRQRLRQLLPIDGDPLPCDPKTKQYIIAFSLLDLRDGTDKCSKIAAELAWGREARPLPARSTACAEHDSDDS